MSTGQTDRDEEVPGWLFPVALGDDTAGEHVEECRREVPPRSILFVRECSARKLLLQEPVQEGINVRDVALSLLLFHGVFLHQV